MCARSWIVGAYFVALVPANIYILLKYPDLEKQVRPRHMRVAFAFNVCLGLGKFGVLFILAL